MEEPIIVKKSNSIVFSVITLVIFLGLIFGIYYWISKNNKQEIVLPPGSNLSVLTNNQAVTTPSVKYNYAKMATSNDWVSYEGKIYKYSFLRPKELSPLIFPNDATDPVTFQIGIIPPQNNLMLSVEIVSMRDKALVGKPEQFVKEYWKFFSGLKSLNSFSEFKNEKGLSGYKATYLAKNNTITKENYFFKLEGDDYHLLRMANIFPAEGNVVFMRMLNSLEYKK